MSPAESSHLCRLLTKLNATCLGQGNVNAGANLLAAMAVTLANLARNGSGIESARTGCIRVGSSLLVSGGISTSLVREHVINEVAIRQNNLLAQVRRLIGDKIEDARKQRLRAVEFPEGPNANQASNALYQLEQSNPVIPMDRMDQIECWKNVIGLPPNPRIEDLAAKPKLLVTARNPSDLERQLRCLHDNRALVALGLHSPAEASALSETCNILLDGLFPCGECGETASGHLLISDPGNVLAEIAPNAPCKATWIGRMVWLTDGNAGPDAVEADAGEGKVRVANMTGRFGEALSSVIARRLNNHDAGATFHHFEFTSGQLRWVKFLERMEGRLPGITGAARSLPASLAFGLIELANAAPRQGPQVNPDEVQAFARWIVLRMANARAAMLGTSRSDRMQGLARRMLNKLESGPLKTRDLYRKLSITAAECEELLRRMESGGLARWTETGWESTGPAIPRRQELNDLFIEV